MVFQRHLLIDVRGVPVAMDLTAANIGCHELKTRGYLKTSP